MQFRYFAGKLSEIDAERYLKTDGLPKGTFLVREIGDNPAGSFNKPVYALSVREIDAMSEVKVCHYRISKGMCYYYIDDVCFNKKFFHSVHELVTHYSMNADDLSTPLSFPLPRIVTGIHYST